MPKLKYTARAEDLLTTYYCLPQGVIKIIICF
jgi:hypothetical protein